MERMLVVVFDDDAKAYEGAAALRKLHAEGSVTVYAAAVVAKRADGTVAIEQDDELAPVGTVVGTSVGSLIGLLGGPLGLAIGSLSGLTLGALVDFGNARVGEDFVADVAQTLQPGKRAVIAEVDEEWTTPVDVRMEALGGTVLRRALWEVRDEQREQAVAAMKADLAQLQAEIASANAERKARLQRRVAQLEQKIDAEQKKVEARWQQFQTRQKRKRETFRKNAITVGQALKELAKTPPV